MQNAWGPFWGDCAAYASSIGRRSTAETTSHNQHQPSQLQQSAETPIQIKRYFRFWIDEGSMKITCDADGSRDQV